MAHRLLAFAVYWTLALLFLGSVVHATESSLACPDWPTCFGTMMPEMTGGVFWEHLHRLWAGGLVILFIVAVIVTRRATPPRPGLVRAGMVGILLLVIQSVLGGLTVIYRLPDAISTSHLALAFTFLSLVTVMAVRTGTAWPLAIDGAERALARTTGLAVASLTFIQSVVGALVRHTDAGVACPDVPLCLGRLIPPLDHPLVRIHFSHRALGIALAVVAIALSARILTRARTPRLRRIAAGICGVVVAQVLLGFASVGSGLGVPWVSLHTLMAASLLSMSVALAAYGWSPDGP